MKRMLRSLAVMVALLLTSCEVPSPRLPTYDFGGNATLKKDVTVVPATATDQAKVTATSVTFPRAGHEELMNLKAGAPFVGARRTNVFDSNNALGLLRKVVSVSADDDNITVMTEPATLEEVIEGDVSVETPAGELKPINPAGLDVVNYFFRDSPGIDLATCDLTGVCTPKADDGTPKPPPPPPPPASVARSPLPQAVPSWYRMDRPPTSPRPTDRPKGLIYDIASASPQALGKALSDVMAVRSGVRDVAVNGLGAYSQDDMRKVFMVASRNYGDAGDTERSKAAKDVADYIADPANFMKMQHLLAPPEGEFSPQYSFSDFVDDVVSVGSAIVNAVTSLLDVNVTLTLPTIGRQKTNPYTTTFISLNKLKKVGKANFNLLATGTVSAYAFVSTSAHFDAHVGAPTTASMWVGGMAGGGGAVDIDATLRLESGSEEDPSALEQFFADPEESAQPWEWHIGTLGPFAGPTIGPVPTTFKIVFTVECSWSLAGTVKYQASADLDASARIGVSYRSGNGFSGIGDFTWNKTTTQQIQFGGGATAECGLVGKLEWLFADAIGPTISLTPSVEAALEYSESCSEALGHRPDSALEMSVKAKVSSSVGATIDIHGLDIGSLPEREIYSHEWELFTHEYSWPGAGLGWCQVSCDDQRKDGTETDVDCGGDCVQLGQTCKAGQACTANGDCAMGGSCTRSVCADPAHCSNGTTDADETDVDCGGSCTGCALAKACEEGRDCITKHCQGSVCAPATCTDRAKNGAETDVDCGSDDCAAIGRLCRLGQRCTVDRQCQVGDVCTAGTCSPPPTCSNGRLDPGEQYWDCSGPCPLCPDGNRCDRASECQSGVCSGSTCAAPSCSDGVKNGTETDLDCGGPCATAGKGCKNGRKCSVTADCVSADTCVGGLCLAPAHCRNGVKDSNETGVDCSGDCDPCGSGGLCNSTADCLVGLCVGGTCRPPSCTDGVKNQDETDVDCGGTCRTQNRYCTGGKACRSWTDCWSSMCTNGTCVLAAHCYNFVTDAGETDLNCGGGECEPCPTGTGFYKCQYERDCQSGVCRVYGGDGCLGTYCDTKTCGPPSCDDSTLNGNETDIDCGGSCAPGRRCAAGKRCVVDADCRAGLTCVTGECIAPATCSDGTKNGIESDVDCGGGVCSACADGKACRGPVDCASGVCLNNACAARTCSDGVRNGGETDVDCGGGCTACHYGQRCDFDSQCLGGAFCSQYGGVCLKRSCYNSVKDSSPTGPNESDVDCGGPCRPCATGKRCNSGADCASGVCTGSTCVAATCSDGKKNQGEVDVDCGGPCSPCADGRVCNYGGDCLSVSCAFGACQPATCADGIKNQGESDTDCGSACGAAGRCVEGHHCGGDGDCQTALSCVRGTCATPSCTDGVKNATETDVDCGGNACGGCAVGQGCYQPLDCALHGRCTNSTCAAPTCTDGTRNGTETEIDCGGGACRTCYDGARCAVHSDCTSRRCDPTTLRCVAGACNDGLSDGAETGVDCGGGCTGCANGGPCAVGSDCVSLVCVASACAVPTCMDATANGMETDVDCGGSCVAIGLKCAVGRRCTAGSDCISGTCSGGACQAAASCTDSRQNGTETDVDCGGTCPVCDYYMKCSVGTDCKGFVCTGGFCAAPSCTDGFKNGNESDVDCGAGCPSCPTGKRCNYVTDCVGGDTCTGGFCTAPATCTDMIKNGAETDTDCGGGTCPTCAAGKMCTAAVRDCQSGVCTSSVCIAATCNDGVKNQTETDTDCGGPCVAGGKTCAVGQRCGATSDCTAPNTCLSSVCTAPATCMDALRNQDESDVDCGGVCTKCGAGKLCNGPTDCASSVCTAGRCATPSCTDGVKNATETDIDCGGGSCPTCTTSKICVSAFDCQSSVCTAGLCIAASCTDSVKNQSETAVDCGGPCVAQGKTCSVGQACGVNADCMTNYCTASLCASAACNDMMKNGSETDVDCGGSCSPCVNGKTCSVAGNCQSQVCTGGTCLSPACAPSCGTGAACGANSDCASAMCTVAGTCAAPACGPNCADGQGCATNADCTSGLCKANVCTGLFGAANVITTGINTFPYYVFAADVNRDGKPDALLSDDDNKVKVFLNQGNGTFGAPTSFPATGYLDWYTFTVGRLNADTDPDVVYSAASQANVMTGAGNGTFGAPAGSPFAVFSPLGFLLADVNNDGNLDLESTNGNGTIAVAFGFGNGTFTSPTSYAGGTSPNDSGIAAGLLDGDTWPDLVATNDLDNNLSFYKGTGSGSFAARTVFATGTRPTAVALADLNGDGKLDAVVSAGGAAVMLGDGAGGFAAPVGYGASATRGIAVADVNGDGKLDLVGAGPGIGVALGKGDGTFAASRGYGPSGSYWRSPALADLDGNGRLDVIIVNNDAPGKMAVFLNQGP